jgi:hypothetical protein
MRRPAKTTLTSTTSAVQSPFADAAFDEAQLAAASFLARYRGRTLEAYRHDLRGFFQWAADHDVSVLAATRPSSATSLGSISTDRGHRQSGLGRRSGTRLRPVAVRHLGDGHPAARPAGSGTPAPKPAAPSFRRSARHRGPSRRCRRAVRCAVALTKTTLFCRGVLIDCRRADRRILHWGRRRCRWGGF